MDPSNGDGVWPTRSLFIAGIVLAHVLAKLISKTKGDNHRPLFYKSLFESLYPYIFGSFNEDGGIALAEEKCTRLEQLFYIIDVLLIHQEQNDVIVRFYLGITMGNNHLFVANYSTYSRTWW